MIYSNAVGGIKLSVLEGDITRALEILNSEAKIEDENFTEDNFPIIGVCPRCKSSNVTNKSYSKWGLFLSWVLGYLLKNGIVLIAVQNGINNALARTLCPPLEDGRVGLKKVSAPFDKCDLYSEN